MIKSIDAHQIRRDIIAISKVLAPLLFVVGLTVWRHEFVVNAISANVAINSMIVVAALYGVVLILLRLISAQVDFKVIERFGKEAKNGAYMPQLLEEPWLKNRYVRHYLAHIAQTGGTVSSELDQNAIESELHALQGEYDSRLELPQFLVGFMIAMGLLGTFIGLLETLTGIAGMLDGLGGQGDGVDIQKQFVKLVSELRKPLAGMGIAFSASMFGLVTSLMLAIMMTNLRRYINRVVALARNVMHDLVEFRHPVGGKDVGSLVIESTSRAFDLDGSGAGGGNASGASLIVASRIDLLIKKLERLMQLFENSIEGSQKLHDLLGFGPRMQEVSGRTLVEIKAIGATLGEQQVLSQKLIDTSGEMVKMLGNVFDIQRQTKSVSDTISDGIKNVVLAQSEQNKLSQKLIDVSSSITALWDEIVNTQRKTAELNEKSVNGITALAQGQETQGRLLQRLIDLQSAAIRIAETELEQQRQMGVMQESTLAETRSLSAFEVEQRQMGQSIIEGIDFNVKTADASLAVQKTLFGEMAGLLRNVEERLIKLEEVDLGGTRHLWSIKESLTKLCQFAGAMDMVSSGVGQQTLLLQALIDEVRTSQRGLLAIHQELQRGNA